MPAHRLLLVCAWVHNPASRSRRNAHKHALSNSTHHGTHLSPAGTHPLSSTPHTCTHTPRHTALHTALEPPCSRTPWVTHRHTRTRVCSHSHPHSSGAVGPRAQAVPGASSAEQPRCPSAPLGVAPARFSAGSHQSRTRPWLWQTSGAAPTALALPATAALARSELAANAPQTEAAAELWERGGTALTSCPVHPAGAEQIN